jgi:hypothetical protein
MSSRTPSYHAPLQSQDLNLPSLWHHLNLSTPTCCGLIYYDLLKNSLDKCLGFEKLGYTNFSPKNLTELLNLASASHRSLLKDFLANSKHYKTLFFQAESPLHSGNTPLWDRGFYLSIKVALQDAQQKDWQGLVSVSPVIQTGDLRVVGLLINCQIIEVHCEAPLDFEFFAHHTADSKLLNLLNQQLVALKKKVLLEKFTRRQQSLLVQMAQHVHNPALLVQSLGISRRTLEGHRAKLLKKGKELFPQIRTAAELVHILVKQGVVNVNKMEVFSAG